jgi:hypothetical protein
VTRPSGDTSTDFLREPAAETGADHDRGIERECVHQIEIKIAEIVDAGDPLALVGSAEARVRGRIDAVTAGQFGEDRGGAIDAVEAVEKQ